MLQTRENHGAGVQNTGTYDPSTLLSYKNPTLASRVRSQSGVLSWIRTFGPTLLNDFHFGCSRIHAARGPFFSGVPSIQELGVRLPLYPSRLDLADRGNRVLQYRL
jgi:hypothetical protein